MTNRDRLLELIRQRNEALHAIGPLARQVLPVGSQVDVLRGDELLRATVEFVDYLGEAVTVAVHGVGRRVYSLWLVLDWNPNAGLALADVAWLKAQPKDRPREPFPTNPESHAR